jgi:hypothetical protein
MLTEPTRRVNGLAVGGGAIPGEELLERWFRNPVSTLEKAKSRALLDKETGFLAILYQCYIAKLSRLNGALSHILDVDFLGV